MNNQSLFILEEPYVSELMLSTLGKNQMPVLKNSISDKYRDLNIVKDIAPDKIYSNSENSIDWVTKNFPESPISKLIQICKNKYEFRKVLKQIYPNFYFDKVLLNEIDTYTPPKEKFIIKPSIGFLSMGVHKVNSKSDWENTVTEIRNEIKNFKKNFPNSVLSSSEFIIEEIIEGEEYAIDAYYNNEGKPVILNIFKHPFVSEDDVSDRAYISSKEIIETNLPNFEKVLTEIGSALHIKNFPIHIEVIKNAKNEVIPVEINPMRFAGWCTTDLAYYAYGINIYEYFFYNKKPDWKEILNGKDGEIYYFAMAETPSNIDKTKIDFDYEGLKKEFSSILDFRKINYLEKPLFAIIFGKTKSYDEITKILQLEMKEFIR